MKWWDLIGNVHLILATVAALVTIVGGLVAALRLVQRRRVSTPVPGPTVVRVPMPAPHLPALDLWQKLLVVGKGLLHGAICGGIAFFCCGLTLGALSLLFSAQLSRILPNASVVLLLICLLAGGVGVLIGLVAGVNRAKREAYSLMLYYRAMR